MEARQLIDSGIIEMYCIGIATQTESQLVETMARTHPQIRKEIDSVIEALDKYARLHSHSPSVSKDKMIGNVFQNHHHRNEISFPPQLSSLSSVKEWNDYIAINNLSAPADYHTAHFLHLPANEKQSTYIAWARKDACVEETHTENETLFMLQGECEITINHINKNYKSGDLIFIPQRTTHTTKVISSEPMIVIGQLIAA